MNICIDIGNSNAKLGIFDHDQLVDVHLHVADRSIAKLLKTLNPDQVIISSVRKGIGKIVDQSRQIAKTLVLSHQTSLPIKSTYQSPETLGVDRIAASVAANFLHTNHNCLIIDAGTCITFDLVDASGTHHGGGISPGVEMRLKSMHKFTSKLPSVVPKGTPELIGKTTTECMRSGAIWGAVAELEGIIARYRQFYDNLTIIICGGDAFFFESKIKDHIFANPNLVLIGLNQILRFNLND